MKRDLFVCNSIYQVLVALWIKHTYCRNHDSDILISNHMNNGKGICEKVLENSEFKEGYFVESFDFARNRISFAKEERIQMNLTPNKYIKKYIQLEHSYSDIYVANLDSFTQFLYDAIAHENKKVNLYLYEDGMYSYSKLLEEDYVGTQIQVKDIPHQLLHKFVYKKNYIYNNVKGFYLFNPINMDWTPDFPLIEMKKIDVNDELFKESCNVIFGYYDSKDSYDKKYIFMEESFAAEGMPINDVELLNQLSELVGKDNIMVKIHPRNPINRFAEQGYTTNVNTSIPWEVIAMNLGDISDKVFITVGSSSILNPILIFDSKIKAYSLYNLVDKEVCKSKLLSGEFWRIIYKMFNKYSNMITICDSIEDIRGEDYEN